MASTPHRMKLTPSNSPMPPRAGRSPQRGRFFPPSPLSLTRVVGNTCASPCGFSAGQSSFAYIAGGAVVVVDVLGEESEGYTYSQRFFRARPTAVPVYKTQKLQDAPSTPTKANDSRNRIYIPARDSSLGVPDWSDSPSSKTWTSRERIKAASCVALSPGERFLAVGETGYAPRVLIFSLEDQSSDRPIVSISEHTIGVKAVAWSPDAKFLASLGAATDGCLYLWKIDSKTGSAKIFQQNRCTSFIRGLIWMGLNLITLGVRHVKVWRVQEPPAISPTKGSRFTSEPASPSLPSKSLPGRNVLLGDLLEATFSCGAAFDETRAIICSETGDICLLDDTDQQMRLTKVLEIGFVTTCIGVRGHLIYIGSATGNFAVLDVLKFLDYQSDCIEYATESPGDGYVAFGGLEDNLVTVDNKFSVDIWSPFHIPGTHQQSSKRTQLTGHGGPIAGLGALPRPNAQGAVFYTWSKLGECALWDVDGRLKDRCQMYFEEGHIDETEALNQLSAVEATRNGRYFITGDRMGMLRVVDMCKPGYPRVFDLKAHSQDCTPITVSEDDSRLIFASCGRDRTVQLFHRRTSGDFDLFQTLDHGAKVNQVLFPASDRMITCVMDRTCQVYNLVTKPDDPDSRAAIQIRSIALKASPVSMCITPDRRFLYVSMLDKSISQNDVDSGKCLKTFKCTDDAGVDTVVLDSLNYRPATDIGPAFILGVSNTDKSVRLYDARSGTFLDREWGHTEGINGAAILEASKGARKVVSAGSDGTIMFWDLDLEEQDRDRDRSDASRERSPGKDLLKDDRPPLRRVLSKASLAEFERSSSTAATPTGRRSPPRTLGKRRSMYDLNSAPSRTPTRPPPTLSVNEGRRSRRPSSTSRNESPPASPHMRTLTKRPSLPALKSNRSKSSSNLKTYGALTTATENTSRALRTYRKKLESSTQSINPDALAELDHELRLTSLALGDKAKQSKEISDALLNGLLDQYSARLMSMLEERLRSMELPHYRRRRRSESSRSRNTERDRDVERPSSSGAGSTTTSGSGSG